MKSASLPETETLIIREQRVPVEIHYEARRNSRVSITKKGVTIRISRFLNPQDKSRQIDEFKSWALRKLSERPELLLPVRKEYFTGKVIAVQDRIFRLHLAFSDSITNSANLNNGVLKLRLSTRQSEELMGKAIAHLISKTVARQFYPNVFERLNHFNERFFPDKKFKALRLKYTNSLWGSCSSEGNITISTRLLLAPDSVLNYVLIHELAHLSVPNHSPRFWRVVAAACPDYEQSEKWLNQYGRYCDF